MRMMHMEFVEEGYWKRVKALSLAKECRVVAIRKAQERSRRQREEARRAQEELLQSEE